MKKIVLLTCALALSATAGFADDSVHLRVSTNFKDEIKQLSVPINEGDSVMDLLRRNSRLKTSFGGAFVSQIDGVPADSEQKESGWFYYVNGILADKGALLFAPKAGDAVWWDFHRWDETRHVSAVIGAFPEPFVHGYGDQTPNTIVASSAPHKKGAEQLVEKLHDAGAKEIARGDLAQLPKVLGERYGIVVGSWEEIKDLPLVKSAYGDPNRTGFHLRIEGDKIAILDIDGKLSETVNGGGFIIALNAAFQVGPTWIVSGTDSKFAAAALETLVAHPERIRHLSGAVVQGERVTMVPAFSKSGAK